MMHMAQEEFNAKWPVETPTWYRGRYPPEACSGSIRIQYRQERAHALAERAKAQPENDFWTWDEPCGKVARHGEYEHTKMGEVLWRGKRIAVGAKSAVARKVIEQHKAAQPEPEEAGEFWEDCLIGTGSLIHGEYSWDPKTTFVYMPGGDLETASDRKQAQALVEAHITAQYLADESISLTDIIEHAGRESLESRRKELVAEQEVTPEEMASTDLPPKDGGEEASSKAEPTTPAQVKRPWSEFPVQMVASHCGYLTHLADRCDATDARVYALEKNGKVIAELVFKNQFQASQVAELLERVEAQSVEQRRLTGVQGGQASKIAALEKRVLGLTEDVAVRTRKESRRFKETCRRAEALEKRANEISGLTKMVNGKAQANYDLAMLAGKAHAGVTDRLDSLEMAREKTASASKRPTCDHSKHYRSFRSANYWVCADCGGQFEITGRDPDPKSCVSWREKWSEICEESDKRAGGFIAMCQADREAKRLSVRLRTWISGLWKRNEQGGGDDE